MAESKDLFDFKRRACATRDGLWSELVYCILAGTQVPIETARRAHSQLCISGIAVLRSIATRPVDSQRRIAEMLRKSGYRYHGRKASTIVAAAVFFAERHGGDLTRFVSAGDVESRVVELVKNVAGIGMKIANHWLRNVGMDTCTIDLHLKRLLVELNVYSGKPERDLSPKEFWRFVDFFRTVASELGRPLGEVQYAVWLAARERSRREHVM